MQMIETSHAPRALLRGNHFYLYERLLQGVIIVMIVDRVRRYQLYTDCNLWKRDYTNSVIYAIRNISVCIPLTAVSFSNGVKLNQMSI